ncbi:phage tail sheath family protein [Tepidanaerobacter syntrophicus]|uniref:Phage tail sheath family protein n=1 Tax=Tepidanaerobacter syntrophicus TaxID=224999 RepID=A0A0U9HDM7_9FIRM|nr:phage tail protein [Tepidanaerobacter syntrophicus]GAQ24219.1 hypothetical protein TSYNT_545 [Tepidanaerobacter syntrophicus]
MAYRHGVYISEVDTSITPAVSTTAGLPVVFGTAPIHLARDPAPTHKPTLCYTYAEAVEQLGYSKDWEKYTLCEFMDSHFGKYACSPVVFVNVLDPVKHTKTVEPISMAIEAGEILITDDGVLLNTITAKLEAGGADLIRDTDYAAAFDKDGNVVITILEGGSVPKDQAELYIGYDKVDASLVTVDDIIGGIDIDTGDYTGLETLNKVFPLFGLVPGMVLAPKWSKDPVVAAVMTAKVSNINGHFKCIAVVDIPTDEVQKYTDVSEWKNTNNYTSARQVVCWPQIKLGDEVYHLSTQISGVMCRTDAENDDIPYVSPSNKNLQANGAVAGDKVIALGPDQASYLNGQGIVTCLNFISGWKAWGNRTGAYPSVTDPKDSFIPVRRMIDWISNTLVLTYWQKVDDPPSRRAIENVVDSANIWLNGLVARGYLLGGRVEFLDIENPVTDLMDGIHRFHVYVTPPAPNRVIEFIVEIDPGYFQTLFA